MVQGLLDEGLELQESVYIEPSNIRRVAKGKKFTVNNQELVGPFTVFENSKIKEVSITPLGADENTSTLIFSDNMNEEIEITTQGEYNMSEEIKEEEVKVEPVVEASIDETLVKEEPKVEAEEAVAEEAKEEEVKEELSEDEEKKFSAAKAVLIAEGIDAALKFACCGGCASKEAKTSSEDVDGLKAEIAKLRKELAEYKKKGKKKQRFSLIEDLSSKTGLKFSESAQEKLADLEDEAFEAVISGLSVEKKQFSETMFSNETDTKELKVELDETNLNTVSETVYAFMDKHEKTTGEKISYSEAYIKLKY